MKSAVKPNKATVSVLPAASTMTPSQAKNIISTIFIHPNEYKMLFTAKQQSSAKSTAPTIDRAQTAMSLRSSTDDGHQEQAGGEEELTQSVTVTDTVLLTGS